MKKTTVYLSAEQKRSLERLAKIEHRSEADIIRDAVTEYAERAKPPKPTLPLFPEGIGDPTASERVDEILAEGFGKD